MGRLASKLSSHLRLGLPKWSLSLRFPHQNPVYISPHTHTRYMPRPSHSHRFYQPNNEAEFHTTNCKVRVRQDKSN